MKTLSKTPKILELRVSDNILLVVMIVCILIGGFAIGMLYNDIPFSLSSKIEIKDYSECNNLSLEDTAYCLRDYVKTFYNFTNRDERIYTGNQGSLEDVKANGGDCFDYSNIYKGYADKLGFGAKTETIFPEPKGEGHRFTFIWDWDKEINIVNGYCILDGLTVNCYDLEQNDTQQNKN